MATKKKNSNGSTNGAVISVERDASILSRKKSGNKSKSNVAHTLLKSADDDRFVAVVDDRELLKVLTEVRNGNFSVRMPIDQVGLSGKICDTLNEIISINEKMMHEFTRAGNTIGKQGRLTQRIELPTSKGS